MLGIVRKRRAVISEVRPFSGQDGVLHLVRLEYKDDGTPETEEVIWEREPNRQLLEPNTLPQASDHPMPAEDFDSLVRAARWTALSPYFDPDEDGPLERMPICSPFHGAVQVEDYQLVPLLKALQMPRINLMIADDVGLGKTIEAGLILRELLIRRRIQRVLIFTPAALRLQWRDEMWSKFSMPFDVIDRASSQKLKRTMGIDANPWRSSARAITSYHYLKQADVLEQFLSASRRPEDSPHLPWDMLVVDEVHNLMPAPFGEDSDLCKTLRYIAPLFEHRLFLTATPHNGRTRSFSGLLELLDPVRFTQTEQLRPAEKERISQVVIRRLKRQINARTNPPKFCTRLEPKAITVEFGRAERDLIECVDAFRTKLRRVIAEGSRKRRLSGTFAIEILGKRLLSGPIPFADSWRRCKLGLREEEQADDSAVAAAERSVHEDTADDRELQQKESTASTVIGAWLKDLEPHLKSEIAEIDGAIEGLNISMELESTISINPRQDARFEALTHLIDSHLRHGNQWRGDERIVIFTEYKTTLDYLQRRLRAHYTDSSDRILCLFGGMEDTTREQIKEAFNDATAKVRILLATDAASEGLNLQETARYLLHYDCPWNPGRIEQRNGRLDRHGQARDVQTFHFASQQDADMRFMSHLIQKVDQIREDLGAVGAILDEAVHQRLIDGLDTDDVQRRLDLQLDAAKGTTAIEADSTVHSAEEEKATFERLESLARELDLDRDSRHSLLDSAMSVHAGRPQLSDPDDEGKSRIINPSLAGWSETIDETVRRSATGSSLGPVPYLAFSADPFIGDMGGRQIFRPRYDVLMMHLGHPMMGKAISSLGRRRFPGQNSVSRWTVRVGSVPAGADALMLLHVEELGVNELRETFHHWIRTYRYKVHGDSLGERLPHVPALELRTTKSASPRLQAKAADLLADLELDLREQVTRMRSDLTARLQKQLMLDGEQAKTEEDARYRSRQGEVSALIADNTLKKLERDIAELQRQKAQGLLFDGQATLDELDRSIDMKEEERKRRESHSEEVREQLAKERDRILNRMLPKRYALHGDAQVFPLAVEIRFAKDAE
jgi:superfamily II DNA or RNA helicase